MNGESGMGLLESLVAIGVAGIALTAFITALSTGSLAVGTLRQATSAQELAQSQIEQIKASAYDGSGASYTIIPTPAGYSIGLNVDSTVYSDNNIQQIIVTVFRNSSIVMILEDYKVNR